ncbi:hypothetical protein [Paenibacillus sp. NPDC058174]|uniref:hypothetical protein n=1 Tax=Paenibacillus sp. NPDC058174 TaxID=3346366 RepID=UPI0036DF59F1
MNQTNNLDIDQMDAVYRTTARIQLNEQTHIDVYPHFDPIQRMKTVNEFMNVYTKKLLDITKKSKLKKSDQMDKDKFDKLFNQLLGVEKTTTIAVALIVLNFTSIIYSSRTYDGLLNLIAKIVDLKFDEAILSAFDQASFSTLMQEISDGINSLTDQVAKTAQEQVQTEVPGSE